METLFGRFPHLVEDIFGLLNGKTLSCCFQIDKIWNANLEGYRLFVIRKMKKHLRNQNIEFGLFTDYDKEDSQHLPEFPLKRLPLQFFVHILRYLCDNKLKDCKINLRNMSTENEPLDLVMWTSKSVGAHNTKSGSKRWCPQDLRVCALAAPLLTHSLQRIRKYDQ